MANDILDKTLSKSLDKFCDDNSYATENSLKKSSKSSLKSNDSGLAEESLQNKESENNDNQNNRFNNNDKKTYDEIKSVVTEKQNKNHNNDGTSVRNVISKKKSRNSLDFSDNFKEKEKKSVFGKIMKKFNSGGHWKLGKSNDMRKTKPLDTTSIEHGVVLKNMKYNLSYKKEKRQRRPALAVRKKLQMPIFLRKGETVVQFNETMKMFGVKFVFVDNFIESVALDEAKVTFADELRDSELESKNKWIKGNLKTITLPLNKNEFDNGFAHLFYPSSSQPNTRRATLSSSEVDLSNKQQFNNTNANKNIITMIKTNKSFFGTSLKELQAGTGFGILKQLIEFIKDNCHAEGIFRIGGRHSKLNALKKEIDELFNRSEKSLNVKCLANELFRKNSPIELAGVLKIFLRELPEPLIPQEYGKYFLEITQANTTISEQIKTLNLLILALPTSHSTPLRMVLNLLNECSRHVDKNKMTIEALALIISPNIFPKEKFSVLTSDKNQLLEKRSNEETFADLMDHTNNAFATICLLINLVDVLFHFPLDVYKNVIC